MQIQIQTAKNVMIDTGIIPKKSLVFRDNRGFLLVPKDPGLANFPDCEFEHFTSVGQFTMRMYRNSNGLVVIQNPLSALSYPVFINEDYNLQIGTTTYVKLYLQEDLVFTNY